MAFALTQKKIKCPNCGYEGKAKIKGSGGGAWLLFLVLFFISFVFWPLFIVAGCMFIWLVFKPADQVCPKCQFANPIPIDKAMAPASGPGVKICPKCHARNRVEDIRCISCGGPI